MQSLIASAQEATVALFRHRLRSSLSALGIVIGVAALSAVLAIGDGLENFARQQILGTTSLQSVMVGPRNARVVEGTRVPIRPERRLALSLADFDRLVAALPPLHDARLEQRAIGEIQRDGDDPLPITLRGVSESPTARRSDEPGRLFGRDLSSEEIRARAMVAVIDSTTARRLGWAPEHAPGQRLELEGVAVEVIGCLEAGGGPRLWMPVESVCLVDLEPYDQPLPSALLEAERLEDVDEVEAALREYLDARDPDWADGAELFVRRNIIKDMQQGMLLFKLFMGAITGISLLVGGIGIMNVLLVSVTERTREIGLRRSLGARSRDIRRQLLMESVLLCGFGSLSGVALGVGMAYFATFVMRRISESEIHAAVTLESLSFAVAVAALIGIAFGMYPARRAARLTPVEALRHE